ncbi:MAG TPA: RDD family protein [Thermosynechococcus sp. M46_R2017_013]|nr:RDD family protein [Thermosynechococcus sp. M46_R2017_013]
MWLFQRRGRLPHSLSSGNVVTIALELYRHQGNRYFLLSLFAHGWFFLLTIAAVLIAVVALIMGGLLAGAINDVTPFLLGAGISILAALPFYLFGWTRLMASGALLSRRIYAVLTAFEESESEARRFIFPKMLNYLLATLIVGFILLIVCGVLGAIGYLIYLVGVPLVQLLEQNIQTEPTKNLFFLTFLLSILFLGLLALLVISYVMARLSLVDVILALEPDRTPLKSVQRSWQLTQGQAWHTLTVFFVASLATIPANLLGNILNGVVIIPVAGFFVAVLLLPLWQGIKAVLYWDLRVRNEGAAFQVRLEAVDPLRWLRRVTLRTPESIELDFALGGIGSRVLAWLIDQIILYTALVLFSLVTGYLYFYALYPWLIEVLPTSSHRIQAWSLGIYLLGMFALYNGYYIFFETYWQGQTPGKRYAEIRVVQDNGRPIGLREATLRSLLQPIDFAFFGIGAFLVALSRSEKRLGDMVAGTLVIQDEQARRLAPKATTLQQPQAAWVQELRSLAHWEQMTPEHYLLVRNYLNSRDR